MQDLHTPRYFPGLRVFVLTRSGIEPGLVRPRFGLYQKPPSCLTQNKLPSVPWGMVLSRGNEIRHVITNAWRASGIDLVDFYAMLS